MKNTNWKDTAELIGIVAIVASLIFVGLQLMQDRRLTQAQIVGDQDDTQIEWARIQSENHELWVKGLDGEELDKLSMARFEPLAGAYFSKRSLLFQRLSNIGGIEPESIAAETAHIILSHPGLKPEWSKRVSWWERQGFMPPFDAAVQKYLHEIESGDLELIKHESYWLY
jgi:hypothetical protein